MADETDQPSAPAGPFPAHPEEMKGVCNLRVGNIISFQGSFRLTPAGVVTLGITAAAIAAAALALARPRRRW